MNAAAQERPTAGPLDLLAQEVTDLAVLADEVQAVISRLAAAAAAPDAHALLEAQAADLLSQRLHGLATFTRALARSSPGGFAPDLGEATRALTLAEQAHRLSGRHRPIAVKGGGPTTFWD